MIYLFCIAVGIGLAYYIHVKVEGLKTHISTELQKVSQVLK
jgi:hypothetical protein